MDLKSAIEAVRSGVDATKVLQDSFDEDSLREDLKLGKKDKAVIDAFTSKKPMEGKKLDTDGKKLDGVWMGGNGIASWKDGKIHFSYAGGRAAQTVQRAVKRNAAPNDIAESIDEERWNSVSKVYGELNDSEMDLLDQALLIAANDSKIYFEKDIKRAAKMAIEEVRKWKQQSFKEMLRAIEKPMVKELILDRKEREREAKGR